MSTGGWSATSLRARWRPAVRLCGSLLWAAGAVLAWLAGRLAAALGSAALGLALVGPAFWLAIWLPLWLALPLALALWVAAVVVALVTWYRLGRLAWPFRRRWRRRRVEAALRPLSRAVPEERERIDRLARIALQRRLRVSEDECGTLYRSGNLALLLVANASAEPDGSRRHYLLRVPPYCVRPRQAVAWCFGLDTVDYVPDAQT
jgi:hypothetical protein